MIRRFLGAVQFLTIIPTPASTALPGASAAFFPVVGALLGASAGVICQYSPLFAIIWLVTITGCLHEDGLADVADALRAGRTREKMLSILKDSRIGTYGAMALIVSFTTRWHALSLGVAKPIASLAAIIGLSRSALVILAALSPPVGTGMGEAFVAACTKNVLLIVLAQALAAAVFLGWQYGTATLAVIFLARLYFLHRLGGVNGDCLGATSQVVEIVCFTLLAWRPSF